MNRETMKNLGTIAKEGSNLLLAIGLPPIGMLIYDIKKDSRYQEKPKLNTIIATAIAASCFCASANFFRGSINIGIDRREGIFKTEYMDTKNPMTYLSPFAKLRETYFYHNSEFKILKQIGTSTNNWQEVVRPELEEKRSKYQKKLKAIDEIHQ